MRTGQTRSKIYGKCRGTVQSVDDPLNMGRIIAKVPSVLGDKDSSWAMPCVPIAEKSHGRILLPEVGDGVWIEFEEGNIDLPIWTGCWLLKNLLQNEITEARPAEIEILSTLKGCRITSKEVNE
jgi:hypothetical protein